MPLRLLTDRCRQALVEGFPLVKNENIFREQNSIDPLQDKCDCFTLKIRVIGF